MIQKKIVSHIIISLLLILLIACGGSPQSSQKPVKVSTALTTDEEILVSFELSNDPNSRWQEITLTITSQNGNPISNAQVSFQQKDLDFMLACHGASDILDAVAYDDYDPTLLRDLGINTTDDYPYFWWNLAEPSDNQFLFDDNTGGWTGMEARAAYEALNEVYPELRFKYLEFGPYFTDVYPDNIPAWIDTDEIDGDFKAQYEEFVRAYMDRFKGQYTFYGVGKELNQVGNEISRKPMEWWVEWIDWVVEIIKEIDPQARVMVLLVPIEIRDFSDPVEFDHIEFIEALIAAGADFDIIGVEYQPSTVYSNDWCYDDLERLSGYGKEIFIWEYYYPSSDDANVSCEEAFGWMPEYYPPGEFTEEWQAEEIVNFAKNAIENPLVIGMDYYVWEDGMWDEENVQTTGLLRNDNVEDEFGIPKLAYHALKDYWHSLFTSGESTSDQKGEVTFRAIPGLFEIKVNGQTKIIHILK